MTAQHMVEHLSALVKISNGKLKTKLYKSEETAAKWKQSLIYTDSTFPKGFKAPMLPEYELPELDYSNLDEAKENLMNELSAFDEFYSDEESKLTLHPTLGNLNKDEWKIFHSKHFTHHFEQFNLV